MGVVSGFLLESHFLVPIFIPLMVAIQFICTVRADTVAENGSGMFFNIGLHPIPVPLIIANTLLFSLGWMVRYLDEIKAFTLEEAVIESRI